MAELLFFSGTMDCGKSTLALQMDHNHKARGRRGVLFSSHDRAGESMISSRLGLQVPAVEVFPETDFWVELTLRQTMGARIDYVICDEAQFYTVDQIDQLARVVDEMDIDVFSFGITSDFRTRLFPGSQRLIELADRVQVLQVEALCWCGKRATHNARTVDGVMVVEGDQMVVGDIDQPLDQPVGPSSDQPLDQAFDPPFDQPFEPDAGPATRSQADAGRAPIVGYETLCRRHHMRRQTSRTSPSLFSNEVPLPFDERPDEQHGTRGSQLQGAEPGGRS
ncbi:thymidine kinase [Arthrobacter sedimenti]|uniref:thymidine kinase n=1 Tax=Arthrobacter sedimenti TaxID=2694931 RepID=UPI000B351F34|nr:thymidine kinase [Arthrobacter sedimenti]OUM42872.1 thymidine kinase [Arthrobacter agilis]